MDVQSLSPARLDELLVEIHDRRIDVMLLCETWHDVDSVSIQRLRAAGFGVVEKARHRPRCSEATLGVNHGGVVITASAGLRVSPVDIGRRPAKPTFECVAARIASGTSSCVVVYIYRTGDISHDFFTE